MYTLVGNYVIFHEPEDSIQADQDIKAINYADIELIDGSGAIEILSVGITLIIGFLAF